MIADIANLKDAQAKVAAAQAALDQATARLKEIEEARAKRRAALQVEVQHMLSGDRHYWEVRDPKRVLGRLAAFVEMIPELVD